MVVHLAAITGWGLRELLDLTVEDLSEWLAVAQEAHERMKL